MSLLDPHSHLRLHQLRQEQLARKESQRKALRLDHEPLPGFRDGVAGILRALAERVATTDAGRPSPSSSPAHPEAR